MTNPLAPGHFPFTFDCPRCGTARIAFNPLVSIKNERDDYELFVWAECQSTHCKKTVIFETRIFGVSEPDSKCIKINQHYYVIRNTVPAFRAISVSKYYPGSVAEAMRDAEECLGKVNPRVARGQFRVALDVATREYLDRHPDLVTEDERGRLKLANRIDKLASLKLITKDLRDWAHSIRTITNDDMHTVEEVSATEAQEIADLTRFLLSYLYDLPARIAAAREAARK